MKSNSRTNNKIQQQQVPQAQQVQQLEFMPEPHSNQQLFADHYLNAILPQRPDWQALATEASTTLHELQQIFATYTPSDKEAQAEEDFIKPVLRQLGHTFEVQASLQTPDGSKTPDYVFYRDQEALIANKNKKLNDALLTGSAIAVGDAKSWDRKLDISLKGEGGDPFTNKNPSYQIAFYMQHSGLDWGILTNGRLWRLYHKETAHKLDRFYEVDLPALLREGDVHNFLYFYAFFRRQAFDEGDLSIEAIRRASIDYARAVSDSLRLQVYDALRHVAQGFLDYPANGLEPDEGTLRQIYGSSLILLYRLLFILYAEARDLLPLHGNVGYSEYYSLDQTKKTVQYLFRFGIPLSPGLATLWAHLKALFTIIDRGDPTLNVTTFNGGLFNPERHPFLEKYAVSDLRLQQAIDKLARVDGQFVDYRDLAERHLGTIYEGLLEFHLFQMKKPEGGWTIDLRNEKGERKTSGSYYTPDYIVKYMVEETLGPVLREAIASAKSEQEKIQAVLNIKVLDPAMGSGHFPVEATDYIARFLVEHLEQSDTGGESELAFWRRRVAQSCIYGVDLNPLAVDLAQLSLWLATVAKDRPLSFLDHHLRCGNSLLGARLSDLKPQTAKVKKQSKKTRTTSASEIDVAQPLLFNEESLRQVMTTAVDLMWLIEANPAQSIADVKEQEAIYEKLRGQLTFKYGKLANFVTATHFGVAIDQTLWQPLSDYTTGRSFAAPTQFDIWLHTAGEVAHELHFFHWELEFPEVFFNRYGQHKGADAGFDVVIGNPPYVRQEKLGPFKPYFAATYPETYDGVADLYTYFYQQGLNLTRAGGRMSYIVTNKWMRSGYGEPLRAFFAQTGALERIVDFGHAPIFPEAEVFPCILVLNKPQPQNEEAPQPERQVQVLDFPREELSRIVKNEESLNSYIQEHSRTIPHNRFGSAAWHLDDSAINDLLMKMRRVGIPLAEFAGVKPYRGVLTGLNEAFLINTLTKDRLVRENPRCAEIIKPYLRGQDIKRWSPQWAELWLITLKSSGDYTWPWSNATDSAAAEAEFQRVYPALYQHLKPFKERLRVRQDQGRYWWELRSCAYYHLFEQPKIITQDLATYPWFSFDDQGYYPVNTCYIWPTADLYILGWLCSPAAWWICHRTLQHSINDTLRMFGEQVKNLPLPSPTDAIRAEIEPAVARLIELVPANHEARETLLEWLELDFDIKEQGKRLENGLELDYETFREEVRKRHPKKSLSNAASQRLRKGYDKHMTEFLKLKTETAKLEHKISNLVNSAYGLTPEEIALLWKTAPPHMPPRTWENTPS